MSYVGGISEFEVIFNYEFVSLADLDCRWVGSILSRDGLSPFGGLGCQNNPTADGVPNGTTILSHIT